MQTGIGKLVDGSGKVTAGLNTLNSKMGELRDGSEKVTGGLNKLVSKSGELKQEQRIYQMVWRNLLKDKIN